MDVGGHLEVGMKREVFSMVVAVVLFAAGLPVAQSIHNAVPDEETVVRARTSTGEIQERSLSPSAAAQVQSMLNALQENPDRYQSLLPALLNKLEEHGLIEDARIWEQTIVEAIQDRQCDTQSNLFMNFLCFIIGNSTNSAVWTPLTLLHIALSRMTLQVIQQFPITYEILYSFIKMLYYSLIYPPKLYFPVGIWSIGWEGQLSSFGLLGHRNTLIDGGKWGEQYLIFGFKGLCLTLPSERGYEYTKNWLIGSATAIVGG